MVPCIPLDQLERLLDEQLLEREQEAVADHVEGCPNCQRRLEDLAAARDAARQRRSPKHALPGPDASFLRRLKERGPRHEPDCHENQTVENEVSSSAQLARHDEPSATVAATVASDFLDADFGPDPAETAASPAAGRNPTGTIAAHDAAGGEPADGVARWTIPGYELLGELGRGGMGVVYRARQVRLNRAVALKMILAGPHAGAEAAARFRAEAEAVAKLQHPNIVQIFHIDEHAGRAYFEMEYVAGGSLADGLDGTPRPPREAARLIETLARAMAEAHRQEIVHRDLKPGNILLTPEGVPKVADFGLVKLLNVDSGLTRTDSVLGSPSYMAPEQAEGKTHDIGPAADIYALGAILYELLTGRPPFRGATVLETLQQVKTAEPVPPSRLVPGLPRDAETVALKCLQKDPAKRYESATALAEDLRRYQAGEPIVARPVGSPERAWRWCQRNPVLAAMAAAVVTLLVAVALGATLSALRFRAMTQELEVNLYFSDITLADRELSADNVGRAQRLLDNCPQGLRQWEWYYLKRLCRVEPVILRTSARIHSVAFRPDGEQIAAASADGTVKVVDARTGNAVQTLRGHKNSVFSVAFSPDGRHLASASEDRSIRLWDVASGAEVFSRVGQTGEFVGVAYSVAFSPDGRRLVAGSEDGGAIVWNVADGSEVRRLPGHEKAAESVAFSPDGRLVATGDWAGVLRIWDARTYQLLRTVPGHHPERISAVKFHPDGRSLATASFDRTVKIWDATTGELLQTLRGHAGLISGLAFSRDGQRLASSGGEEKTVKIWDPLTGGEILNLRGHTLACNCLAFSPDGRRLASASSDGTIRVWDASPLTGNEGLESLNIDLHEEVWSVTFGPDGRSLAAGSFSTVQLLDPRTGDRLRTYAHEVAVERVVFSPDGRQLAAALGALGHVAVVKVWDVATGGEALDIRDKSMPFSVAFDPDGRYLLKEGPDRTVKVWDAQTGHEAGVIGRHDDSIWAIKFSPDGRRLATASNDATVRVWAWDPARLSEMQKPELTLAALVIGFGDRVAFSTDGLHLAAGGEEHTIKVWDAKTGEERQTLHGHTGDIFAVAFDRQGQWLASAGEDTTVRLWDATSSPWKLRHTLRGHTGLMMSLAFSPDGRRLVSGSRDGTAKVWDLTQLGNKPEE